MKLKPTIRNLGLLSAALTLSHQIATAAQAPVALGSAGNYAVLAGSTITSSGLTVVNGDLGLSPGTSLSGFPPGTVIGTKHIADPAAAAAKADLTIAYNDAAGRSTAPISVAGNLGGQTLTPGLYKSASSLAISSGDLTLDGQGDINAVFIFQMGTTLVTTSGRQVILIGGAQAANVFWQVGTSATIGSGSGMKGTILANQSISFAAGATLAGRALARIGGVTLIGDAITRPGSGTGGGGGGGASTNVVVSSASPITLNPQTGLFEQTVRLSNIGPNTVTALRLLITALPGDVQVYNKSGTTNGTPFVRYNQSLAPQAAVNLKIEYYRASRAAIPQPGFLAQETTVLSVTATGTVLPIDRFVKMADGRFLIEFTSTQGRTYAVQYGTDMISWKTAVPTITAPANRVQWYDDGPPKTESAPSSVASRMYRVLELP
jgi:hypothetical protein